MSTILVQYDQFYTTCASVQKISANMEENIQHLTKLRNDLIQAFIGAGATAYTDITNTLNTKLQNYQSTVVSLNQAAVKAADHLKHTDQQAATAFTL